MKRQTLTTAEVSKLLGRSIAHVAHMVRQGTLIPCGTEGRRYLFDRDEVETYKSIRALGASPARVAGWAIQAKAAVASLEKRIEAIYEILGLDPTELDRTTSGVSRLYEVAKKRSELDREATPQEVADWARVLHSIDGAYLGLISHVMVDQEPWRVFMAAADAIKTGVSRIQLAGDPVLERSFRALLHARNQLRAVAYLYAQPRIGRRELRLAFTDDSIDQELLGLIKKTK
jgi:excisionase family DNA binding protein